MGFYLTLEEFFFFFPMPLDTHDSLKYTQLEKKRKNIENLCMCMCIFKRTIRDFLIFKYTRTSFFNPSSFFPLFPTINCNGFFLGQCVHEDCRPNCKCRGCSQVSPQEDYWAFFLANVEQLSHGACIWYIFVFILLPIFYTTKSRKRMKMHLILDWNCHIDYFFHKFFWTLCIQRCTYGLKEIQFCGRGKKWMW